MVEAHDARRVHQNVQPAIMRHRRRHGTHAVGARGNVGGVGNHGGAFRGQFPAGFFQPLGQNIHEEQGDAVGGQRLGNGAAQPARGAGYQRNFLLTAHPAVTPVSAVQMAPCTALALSEAMKATTSATSMDSELPRCPP